MVSRKCRPSFFNGLQLLLVVSLAFLAGCAATIERNPVPAAFAEQLPPVNRIPGGRTWGDDTPADVAAELRRHFPNMPQLARDAPVVAGRKQIEILALSGGGPDGAFGAGLLKGWTARGDRPVFELVTGVSAGALIAPFAFLGPEYDKALEEVWTQYETRQLVTAQFLPGLLGGPALTDTAPLRELIAKHVDAKMLRRVAAEYRRGRVLTIGTTNLDARRPVVWNMGEIAHVGNQPALELFRDVILASASIPGLFPPVNIKVMVDGKTYDEMHVDGGVTRQIYTSPLNVPLQAFDRFYAKPPKRTYYLVQNNKLTAQYEPVKEQTIPIAASSISTLLTSQNKGDLYRIYRTTADAGADFNLLSVPDSFAERKSQAFDPAYQRALFDEGYRIGYAGGPWLKAPPDVPQPAGRAATPRAPVAAPGTATAAP